MPTKIKLKKGDKVLVIAGKDKGRQGQILRLFPDQNRAIVEMINMVKKHTRPNPQQQIQGGILETEAPIHISNLKLICPESGKPTRVGRTRLADGKGARVSKVSGATIG